ncbi:MAG: hypothetical protein QM796_07935 [Chthoniobacteraceae bacterium]
MLNSDGLEVVNLSERENSLWQNSRQLRTDLPSKSVLRAEFRAAYHPRHACTFSMLKSFREFLSVDAIERELSKERIRVASRANEKLFWFRISTGAPSPTTSEINALFPPRRLWNKFRPRRRSNLTAESSNQTALWGAVRNLRLAQPEPSWSIRLRQRAELIRNRVFEQNFAFSSPRIIAEPKEVRKHEYRPIGQFELDDKIIDSLTAKYFRINVDTALEPCCLAFRLAHDGGAPPSIHDALSKLLTTRRRNPRGTQWVAECDIRGFYDCVSHQVALDSLQSLFKKQQ